MPLKGLQAPEDRPARTAITDVVPNASSRAEMRPSRACNISGTSAKDSEDEEGPKGGQAPAGTEGEGTQMSESVGASTTECKNEMESADREEKRPASRHSRARCCKSARVHACNADPEIKTIRLIKQQSPSRETGKEGVGSDPAGLMKAKSPSKPSRSGASLSERGPS